ncbi:MAG: RNA polymerase sigma factor [Bacillota bacterium]
MDVDDSRLIVQCRNGEEEGFRLLLGRYEAYIYRLCRRLTGHPEDALELTQEVFLKIVTGLEGFQVNRPFKPWLRRLTVNTCINFLRSRGREVLILDEPAGSNPSRVTPAAPVKTDPQVRAEWIETCLTLQSAIERLPPPHRLVLVLRHQEEMNYQEIAEVTGLPLGTVKTYLFRARGKLRQLLSDAYGWEETENEL